MRALLAYLVANAGTKLPKNRITDLLWGDRGDAQARASLRQAVLELRRALNSKEEFFFSDREHVWIADDRLIVDAHEVQEPLRDLFEDLDDISPAFDDWLAAERLRRGTKQVEQLKNQAEKLLVNGRAAESCQIVDQIQALDPGNEDALRLGMESEFELGRPAAVARRYKDVARVLKGEFGVEPSTETRALREKLLSQLTTIDRASELKCVQIYESVERAFQMGAWECDLITGEISWTQGTFALFGVPAGSAIRREDILEQYDASSRKLLEKVRDEAIRRGTGFNVTVDIFTLAGARKRLRIDAAVERRGGRASRIFGTKQLVTGNS